MIQLQNIIGRKDEEPARQHNVASEFDIDQKVPKQKLRTLYVKKSQIDPTALLSYGLGVSIIHLAMLVTIF